MTMTAKDNEGDNFNSWLNNDPDGDPEFLQRGADYPRCPICGQKMVRQGFYWECPSIVVWGND